MIVCPYTTAIEPLSRLNFFKEFECVAVAWLDSERFSEVTFGLGVIAFGLKQPGQVEVRIEVIRKCMQVQLKQVDREVNLFHRHELNDQTGQSIWVEKY
jgi:hypothetical protein